MSARYDIATQFFYIPIYFLTHICPVNKCLYKGVHSYEFDEFKYFTFTHPDKVLLRLWLNSSIVEMFMNELIVKYKFLHVTVATRYLLY